MRHLSVLLTRQGNALFLALLHYALRNVFLWHHLGPFRSLLQDLALIAPQLFVPSPSETSRDLGRATLEDVDPNSTISPLPDHDLLRVSRKRLLHRLLPASCPQLEHFRSYGVSCLAFAFLLAGISRSSGVSSVAVSLSFPLLPLRRFELEAHPL